MDGLGAEEEVEEVEEAMRVRYRIFQGDRLVAEVNGWNAKQAALRLLYGTSLVLPPNVRTEVE